MDLKGKVAIVTGAGQGIGKEIALELSRNEAILVLADIRDKTIEKVREEIEEMGREVFVCKMDVSKWEDAERMVKKVIERFRRIDILVNNAGISPRGKGGIRLTMQDIDDQVWDTVMKVNLKGVFNCCKAVMPFMIKQAYGKMVNIGSVVGLTGGANSPASAAYCVSKAGVICLTKVLAGELAQYNINVNAIAPGRIDTPLTETISAEIRDDELKYTPLGRYGKPIDIARAVLYLVSESGNFITGETLVIDGGRALH